jgi:hypothetical protein
VPHPTAIEAVPGPRDVRCAVAVEIAAGERALHVPALPVLFRVCLRDARRPVSSGANRIPETARQLKIASTSSQPRPRRNTRWRTSRPNRPDAADRGQLDVDARAVPAALDREPVSERRVGSDVGVEEIRPPCGVEIGDERARRSRLERVEDDGIAEPAPGRRRREEREELVRRDGAEVGTAVAVDVRGDERRAARAQAVDRPLLLARSSPSRRSRAR